MKVGSRVIPRDQNHPLACGSGIYPYAIIKSIDPFVLVSEQGDMTWFTRKIEDFVEEQVDANH